MKMYLHVSNGLTHLILVVHHYSITCFFSVYCYTRYTFVTCPVTMLVYSCVSPLTALKPIITW